jgi:hypothetical protein
MKTQANAVLSVLLLITFPKAQAPACKCQITKGNGGEGGIRTPDTLSGMPVFKTGAINHSATSPATYSFTTLSILIGRAESVAALALKVVRIGNPGKNKATH